MIGCIENMLAMAATDMSLSNVQVSRCDAKNRLAMGTLCLHNFNPFIKKLSSQGAALGFNKAPFQG